ncbi:transposase [Neomoorella mulderi]|uniref:transposase n=1 Tax=Neomoorella mulderi TaxID=202604 RepID=UPI0038B23CC1
MTPRGFTDASYYSRKNIEALKAKGIEVFIPPDKVKHSEWRHPARVPEELPGDATLKEQMRHKLRTEEGRRWYKLRKTTIEPIFGQIKEGRGLRQFLLRGLNKVRSSWRFECAVHYLIKLFTFMRKHKHSCNDLR